MIEHPARGESMSIASLHPHQQRIVAALQSATRVLQAGDHMTIVGSLARFLAGPPCRVGDIDIWIEARLCERYWDFVEILSAHGITPVFDLLDRPAFPWRYCVPVLAHGQALTVDCPQHRLGLKCPNLDIMFSASDLALIPNSDRWVYGLPPDTLIQLDETTKSETIRQDHEKLVDEIKKRELQLGLRTLHGGLGFYYTP